MPLNGTKPSAGLRSVIDGVFADGTGFLRCPGISSTRCAALLEGKRSLIREMQAVLNEFNGGLVFQNPPRAFEALETLDDAGAIMGEHFAAFEQVVKTGPTSYSYDASKIEAYMRAVAVAAAANKTVIVATWPGPLSTPFTPNGFPSWINGLQPTTAGDWKACMAEYHAFALAGYLTMAEENVWMQYQTWYNGFSQGAISCGASLTCSAPVEWYPDLYRPLGRPLGPARREGNKWTRIFENAISVFDLDNPLRNGTYVTFFEPSLSSTRTATPTSSPSLATPPALVASPLNNNRIGTGVGSSAVDDNHGIYAGDTVLGVILPLLVLACIGSLFFLRERLIIMCAKLRTGHLHKLFGHRERVTVTVEGGSVARPVSWLAMDNCATTVSENPVGAK